MFTFTEKEKQIIRDLNLHPYTVAYCEEYLNRKPENIQINAPVALIQLGVEEFVKTVRRIAEIGNFVLNETPTASNEGSQEPMYKEGICPVCGGLIAYGSFDLVDEGGTFDWTCGSCGATGREGYDLVFDGSHYDVELSDGTKFDDIPDGFIGIMTVDTKTVTKLTPMIQCASLDYGANRICKDELLYSQTIEIGYGYSAELRVTAGVDGEPLCVNVWLLLDGELLYDYDGEDTITGTYTMETEDDEKIVLIVKEEE